jgi:hypothetical protein
MQIHGLPERSVEQPARGVRTRAPARQCDALAAGRLWVSLRRQARGGPLANGIAWASDTIGRTSFGSPVASAVTIDTSKLALTGADGEAVVVHEPMQLQV